MCQSPGVGSTRKMLVDIHPQESFTKFDFVFKTDTETGSVEKTGTFGAFQRTKS